MMDHALLAAAAPHLLQAARTVRDLDLDGLFSLHRTAPAGLALSSMLQFPGRSVADLATWREPFSFLASWGQQADVPDAAGDLFTASCLAALCEPHQDEVVWDPCQVYAIPAGIICTVGEMLRFVQETGKRPAVTPEMSYEDFDVLTAGEQYQGVRVHSATIHAWMMHDRGENGPMVRELRRRSAVAR